jgi:hypothetical protein
MFAEEQTGTHRLTELSSELDEVLHLFLTAAVGPIPRDTMYAISDFLTKFGGFVSCYELPLASKVLPKETLESHYEDFLSYQTHNPQNLEFCGDLR